MHTRSGPGTTMTTLANQQRARGMRTRHNASRLRTEQQLMGPLVHPQQLSGVNQRMMSETVLNIADQNTVDNNSLAFDPKKDEFRAYCESKAAVGDDTIYLVTKEKVHEFMFYQAFRERKKQGGKRKRGESEPTGGNFDTSNFRTVIHTYQKIFQECLQGTRSEIPEPQNPVGHSLMAQCKCAVKHIHTRQVAQNANSLPWEFIWTEDTERLMKMVSNRKERINKKNYKEKIDHDFAPHAAIQELDSIESCLWKSGYNTSRQAFCGLRNRCCFLQTFSGILRGESVYKAELSDLLCMKIQKDSDPHPLTLLIMQTATGKTNKGVKLCGRSMRHLNPLLCSVGSLGFMLLYRFYLTGEMDQPPDFTDNKSWFDIKLLVDSRTTDNTVNISDATCGDAMKKIGKEVGIPMNHCVHFGRVLGAVEMEFLERPSEETRTLGNWDPKTQEKFYSTKLPMPSIRAKGGFHKANGMHFNPRTVVEPPEELQATTFPFVEESHNAVVTSMAQNNAAHHTAINFLVLLKELRRVILQDAAAILELHPERSRHPLFQMEVFQHPLFLEFRQTMRESLQSASSPADSSLSAVLPGVHERLSSLSHGQQQLEAGQKRLESKLDGFVGEYRANEGARSAAAGQLTLAASSLLHGRGLSRAGGSAQVGAGGSSRVEEGPGSSTDTADTGITTAAPEGFGYKPPRRNHSSVQSIYDQWHGLSAFKDKPVVGGLEKMESDHKCMWRKDFDKADSQYFSRVKRIVKAIDSLRSANPQKTASVIIEEMNTIYKAEANQKLSNFVKVLKDKNYI